MVHNSHQARSKIRPKRCVNTPLYTPSIMSKRKQEETSEELECDGDGAVTKRPTKQPVIEILDDEPDVCSICSEPCCHPAMVNRRGCKHMFCHLCIHAWMDQCRVRGSVPTCPLCRAEITSCRTTATHSRYVKRLLLKLRRMRIRYQSRSFDGPDVTHYNFIRYSVDPTRVEQERERLAKEGIPLTFTAMQLPPRMDTSQGASSSTAIEID